MKTRITIYQQTNGVKKTTFNFYLNGTNKTGTYIGFIMHYKTVLNKSYYVPSGTCKTYLEIKRNRL